MTDMIDRFRKSFEGVFFKSPPALTVRDSVYILLRELLPGPAVPIALVFTEFGCLGIECDNGMWLCVPLPAFTSEPYWLPSWNRDKSSKLFSRRTIDSCDIARAQRGNCGCKA